MGIDYYSCIRCRKGFPDVSSYKACECGTMWCGEDCAEKDGRKAETMIDEDGDEVKDDENTSCAYCRNEKFDDKQLLAYSLKLLKISKEDLIEKCKEANNNE